MIQVASLGARFGGDTSDFDRAAGHVRGTIGSIGGEFEGLGVKGVAMGVAFGQALVATVAGAARAVSGLVSSAIGNVAGRERDLMTLQSLIGAEIIMQNQRKETVRVGGMVTMDTLKQTRGYQELSDKLAIAKAKYDDMARSRQYWGNDPVKVSLNEAELNQRRRAMEDLQAQMSRMTGAVGSYRTEVRTLAPTEAERTAAWAAAAVQAKELTDWITKLAIESPFDEAGVMSVVKYGKAYGFTVEEIKKMTPTLMDMAAASGQSSAALGDIGYIIGQIRGSGKVLTQDVRQLATRGVPLLNETLAQFGATMGTIGEKGIKSDDFIKALLGNWSTYFSGAAKAQAGTFAGLMASFTDLGRVAERNLFGPAFEKMRPTLQRLVDTLQRPEVRTALEQIGKSIGDLASGPMNVLSGALDAITGPLKVFHDTLTLTKDPAAALRNTLRTMLPPEVARPVMMTIGLIERLPMLFDGGANAAVRFGQSFGAVFGGEAGQKAQEFALTVQDFAGKIGGALARTFGIQLSFTPSGWPDASKLVEDLRKKAEEWWDKSAVPALKGAAGGAAALFARVLGIQLSFTPSGWPDAAKMIADVRAGFDAWWAAEVAPKLVDASGQPKPVSLQMAIDIGGAVFTGADTIGARLVAEIARADIPAQLGAALGNVIGAAFALVPRLATDATNLQPARDASFATGKAVATTIVPAFVQGVAAGVQDGWKQLMGDWDIGTVLTNLSMRVFTGATLPANAGGTAPDFFGQIGKALGLKPGDTEKQRKLFDEVVAAYDPTTGGLQGLDRMLGDIATNIENALLMRKSPVPVRVPGNVFTYQVTPTPAPMPPGEGGFGQGPAGFGWPSYAGGQNPFGSMVGGMTEGVGESASSGVVAGLQAGQEALDAAMRQSMSAMVQAARDEMEAQSPSQRTYREIGTPAWQGVVSAINDGAPLVKGVWTATMMDAVGALNSADMLSLFYSSGAQYAMRVAEGFKSEAARIDKEFMAAVDRSVAAVITRIVNEVYRRLR